MYTFELIAKDGSVWAIVTVRAASVTAAADVLRSTRMELRWI